MKNLFYIALTAVLLCISSISYGQRNEFGFMLGTSHYFGDLNTKTSFAFLGPSGGIFMRQNFGTRVSLKYMGSFGVVEFKDESVNEDFNRQRNLSFKSNIMELSTHFEFNFFEYDKYDKDKFITPYIATGFSIFFFNPRAEYNGEWYELQPLGTEGQNFPEYTGRKKYNLYSFAIPIVGGLKVSLDRHWNIGFEAGTRKTFTDYLDDVSTTYVGPISLPGGDRGIAHILSDRSGELGAEPIGTPGAQRGLSSKKDDYFFASITFSYTIFSLKCPKPYGIR